MWYPNRAQWVAIWISSLLALAIWILNVGGQKQIDRLATGIVCVGALLVWQLSKKKTIASENGVINAGGKEKAQGLRLRRLNKEQKKLLGIVLLRLPLPLFVAFGIPLFLIFGEVLGEPGILVMGLLGISAPICHWLAVRMERQGSESGLESNRQERYPAKTVSPQPVLDDASRQLKTFGQWVIYERDTHATGFWGGVLETIRALLVSTLSMVPLAVILAVLMGFVFILSFPYEWARAAWFPGISQTMEIILVTIIIPLSILVAMGLWEVLEKKWSMWKYRRKKFPKSIPG